MSTGINGLVLYLGYLWPNMSQWQIDLVSFALVGLVLFALYRRIESIGVLTNVLFMVMLVSIGTVIVATQVVLRRRQPNLRRPYRMWLYPLLP